MQGPRRGTTGQMAPLRAARELWAHLEEDDIAELAAELGFRSFLEPFTRPTKSPFAGVDDRMPRQAPSWPATGPWVYLDVLQLPAMPEFPEAHRDLLDAPVAILSTQGRDG